MGQQETFTKEQFWAELDEAGEATVRERVITRRYGSGNNKLQLAEEWLRLKDVVRSEKTTREQLRISRSSRNAAWVAASAAVIAVVISVVALYFSLRT